MKLIVFLTSQIAAVATLALLLVLPSTAGCAKAPPTLTPQAVVAFHGTQIIHDLDRIRDAAVDAHKTVPPLISAELVLTITTWHESAIAVVHDAKDGWKAAVLTSLDRMSEGLSATAREAIAPYVAVARMVLNEVVK